MIIEKAFFRSDFHEVLVGILGGLSCSNQIHTSTTEKSESCCSRSLWQLRLVKKLGAGPSAEGWAPKEVR